MKIISSKTVTGGTRYVVELKPDERLLAVDPDAHYCLGHPLDDVVPGHVLRDSARVSWCPIEQKWV